eukprot:2102705-Prymnesium_polylepis.1
MVSAPEAGMGIAGEYRSKRGITHTLQRASAHTCGCEAGRASLRVAARLARRCAACASPRGSRVAARSGGLAWHRWGALGLSRGGAASPAQLRPACPQHA